MYGTSGNKQIDNYIQETQLKVSSCSDVLFEWIPYNQFNNIKEVSKGDFSTVYSAIWKDGPLNYKYRYMRSSDKKVALRSLHNSQNAIDEFLNEGILFLKFI